MKPLKSCANGCKAPPQPPSKVLCAECFAGLDRKMHAVLSPKVCTFETCKCGAPATITVHNVTDGTTRPACEIHQWPEGTPDDVGRLLADINNGGRS